MRPGDRERNPELVLLDVGLPGELDGLGVSRHPGQSDIPIIFLTAAARRSIGFNSLGADDYVTKPFSPRELVARVKTILRRSSGTASAAGRPTPIDLGWDLMVDPGRREVTLAGEPMPSPLASSTFCTTSPSTGLALSRLQLLDGVWGVGWVGDDRTVDVHVRQLRKKLGGTLRLETVWGVGYRLD